MFVVKSDALTHTGDKVKYGQQQSEAVDMEVIFVADNDGNGTITIKHVPVGEYTVYEKNNSVQTNKWTWRYSKTDRQIKTVELASENKIPFAFNNDASKIVIWLSHFAKNFFKVTK